MCEFLCAYFKMQVSTHSGMKIYIDD